MLHDVVSAIYNGGYLTFDDGKKGTVDFSEYLAKGGVFDRFMDIDFFRNFSVNDELGTLTWQNNIDLAPEQLYMQRLPGIRCQSGWKHRLPDF